MIAPIWRSIEPLGVQTGHFAVALSATRSALFYSVSLCPLAMSDQVARGAPDVAASASVVDGVWPFLARALDCAPCAYCLDAAECRGAPESAPFRWGRADGSTISVHHLPSARLRGLG